MKYADANLFVYAALNKELGQKCAEYIYANSLDLATSSLTIDEVAWALTKGKTRGEAIDFCKHLLSSGIKVLPVDGRTAQDALRIMEMTNLKPRDAFHAASMKLNDINEIVSQDRDFDRILGIKRTWMK